MLPLRISASSGVPVYLQLEQQITQAIASGLLNSGDPLPSVRKMAAELRINPNTVARAYQNVERDGVIRTVPGGGTFAGELTAVGQGLLKSEKLRRLRPLADQLVVVVVERAGSMTTKHRRRDVETTRRLPVIYHPLIISVA